VVPEQPDRQAVHELSNKGMISGTTALVGLLGQPVSHSLSPVMQNAALKAMGLNWSFLALPCGADDLATVLKGMEAVGCRGLNVTIPHKQAVSQLCDELSPLAQRLGAVNTLTPLPNGGWHGHNTDVEGFLAPLLHNNADWSGTRAVVLGCGGSARAVVAGLQDLSPSKITIVGRRIETLHPFCIDLQQGRPANSVQLQPFLGNDPHLQTRIQHADLVVNTTPIGMSSHQPDQGLALPLGVDIWDNLTPQTILYDLIYTPRPTPWLQRGERLGCRTYDGLEMLVQQGAAALRRWSGIDEVPVDAMREAALKNLSRP
jgi:shikimate dehydrogenase